jgi:hypothetical protein
MSIVMFGLNFGASLVRTRGCVGTADVGTRQCSLHPPPSPPLLTLIFFVLHPPTLPSMCVCRCRT